MIKSLESFFLGLLLGVFFTIVIGFGFYNWSTVEKGNAKLEKESDRAVINSLAAVCVERFKNDPRYSANLSRLKAVDKFSLGDFMEIGWWSKFSTSEHFELEISNLCAKIILSQIP
jgi:hypothetical protein